MPRLVRPADVGKDHHAGSDESVEAEAAALFLADRVAVSFAAQLRRILRPRGGAVAAGSSAPQWATFGGWSYRSATHPDTTCIGEFGESRKPSLNGSLPYAILPPPPI